MSYKVKNKNLDIAILGISAALIIVLQALAEGLRLFGLPLSLALGLIPVLVVAQLRGWKTGMILGTVFGLTSFVIGVIQMAGIEGADAIRFNPLVTVLPRTLVGLVVGLLSGWASDIRARRRLCTTTQHTPQSQAPTAEQNTPAQDAADRVDANPSVPVDNGTKGKKIARFSRDYLVSALVTLAGVLTNTIGFLGMFYAFGHGLDIGYGVIDFRLILTMVVAINTVIEAVSYVVLVPAIVQALKKAKIFSR